MKARWFLCAAVFASGCGPGMADFEEQIGNSPYLLVRTSSDRISVEPIPECGTLCPRIPPNVTKLRSNDHVIVALRQEVNDYRCDDHTLVTEVIDRYTIYVIEVPDNRLVGPLSVAEFNGYSKTHAQRMADIQLFENGEYSGTGATLKRLSNCTNPRRL